MLATIPARPAVIAMFPVGSTKFTGLLRLYPNMCSPNNSLAGACIPISTDKPAHFGAVVTGAEEVETGKDVVDVAAVSEGVVLAKCAGHVSGGAENIAPCVISVFYHEIAGAVYR